MAMRAPVGKWQPQTFDAHSNHSWKKCANAASPFLHWKNTCGEFVFADDDGYENDDDVDDDEDDDDDDDDNDGDDDDDGDDGDGDDDDDDGYHEWGRPSDDDDSDGDCDANPSLDEEGGRALEPTRDTPSLWVVDPLGECFGGGGRSPTTPRSGGAY